MDLRQKVPFFINYTKGHLATVIGTDAINLPKARPYSLKSLTAFGDAERSPQQYIDSVTLSGGTEQRDIPDNYLQRQYIYMMDNSYLLPSITPEADWHIEMDFQTTSVSTQVRNYFGSRYVGAPVGAGIRLSHTGSGYIVLYGFDTTNPYAGGGSSYKIQSNTRYKYVYNNNSASLSTGGTVVDSTTFTVNDTTTREVAINNYSSSDTWGTDTEGIYLYSFKAWNGQGELVMDLVPAVQKGTVPVVGFYDTVSKTFKPATAGTFSAGGEAVPTPDYPMDIVSNNGVVKARHQSGLPLGYTLLDSVVFDSTQVIDTGFTPDNNSRIESKCYRTGSVCWFYGAGSTNPRVTLYISDTGISRWGSQSGRNFGLAANTDYTLVQDKNGLSINGMLYPWNDGTAGDFTATNVLNIGTPDTASSTRAFAGNFYYMKVYDNGTLARDFVPCKNASNVVGLYDLVNGVFYTDTGLVAGNTVNDPVEIYTDGTVEQVTDSLSNTATAEMLLKVGDYQDTQEVIAGDVTRNVGIKVLDGTENWTAYNGGEYFPLGGSGSLPATTIAYCSHFTYAGSGALIVDLPMGGFTIATNGNCSFKSSNTTTKAAWVAWLAQQYNAGTPVIVIYPLATSTTETVAGQFLSKSPVTQTAGSISNLPITVTESSHTVPTPQQPLDITCNNGVVKVSKNLFDMQIEQGNIGNDGANSSSSARVRTAGYIPVSPNATYTLSVDIDDYTGSSSGGVFLRFYNASSGDFAEHYLTGDSWHDPRGGYTFTTPAGAYGLRIIFAKGSTATTITPSQISNIQLELGSTATPYMPHGQIYTDGTVETINAHGKNLFDQSTATRYRTSWTNSGDGSWQVISSSSEAVCYGSYVKPNTTYTLSKKGGSRLIITGFRTKIEPSPLQATPADYKIRTDTTEVVDGSYTFTTPADCTWILFGLRQNNSTPTFPYDVQLELGSTATDYEPYYNGGTATAEMLLSLGNYTDEQEILSGTITRNVGVKVLYGTETVAISSGMLRISAVLPVEKASGWAARRTCTHGVCGFANVSNNNIEVDGTYIWFGGKTITDMGWTAAEDGKAWIAQQYNAGTPVIVVYPLATPTTDSVTGQTLQVQKGNNIAEITQASLNNLELEATYRRNK